MSKEAAEALDRMLSRMEDGMGRGTTMTALSVRYRQRASEFARAADDHHADGRREEAMRSVQSALSWIQLAENEERLGARAGLQ
jgi:L-serine deaminase